ncbi:uncharacterized protein EV422DRAFT_506605 [Fimicolochytrium jonesii]|uniref:uncharacterized protein n=1 Tax=Fimicolochytrium jonesii TaxID=1396493 RepID=UPI0022FEEBBD|nr:uncharacterized protein EV422DRAFT_506605 [Fimicolochytrium jonesii]KAI8820886.1 hypothetical protein EV422DRAFT_506605 [Fimicolochytrium jonesii]
MSFLSKPLVKRLMAVSHREKISDEDFITRCRFITGTIMGSGWECKEYERDFCRFNSIMKPVWRKLYDRWIENEKKEWACFDKPGKLEFVKNNAVTESISMPNEWASGSGMDDENKKQMAGGETVQQKLFDMREEIEEICD